jgi:short-subunit dehydrogenase
MELRGTDISVSLLSPGGINTKPELLVLHDALNGISRTTVLEPEEVAREAIDGMLKGKKEIIPGAFNRFLVWLDGWLPTTIKEMLIRRNMKNVL